MINYPELKRPLTEDEALWLDAHIEFLCHSLPAPLIRYGVREMYSIPQNYGDKPESFFDNYIVVFTNGMVEIWGADSIETISELATRAN